MLFEGFAPRINQLTLSFIEVRSNIGMYHIRSALTAPPRESLITNPELEVAYLNVLKNTNPNATLELWRNILTQEFPSTNANDSFIINSTVDLGEIEAVSIIVSLRAPRKAEHDPRVLLALGFQGNDKDSKNERERLETQFMVWSKKEMKKDSDIRYFFGLLTVGVYARFLKYDRHEGVLKPFHEDQWLGAKSCKWSDMIEDVKEAIAEGTAAM